MADSQERPTNLEGLDPKILKAVENYLKRQAYNKAWRQRTGYNRRRWQEEKALLQRARELGLL
jgi:hypothetical protein